MPRLLMLACFDNACRGRNLIWTGLGKSLVLNPLFLGSTHAFCESAMLQVQYAELYRSSSQD